MISQLLTILPLLLLALLSGLLLAYAGVKLKVGNEPVIEMIDKLLPQTQCGQCGYPGCRPYAEAMARGDAINKCPPGGDQGIKALARLLGKTIIPLDNNLEAKTQPTVTFIREDDCIGCTKCIDACPVDAIVGTAKMMHTVIIDQCTGCDLCIPPCPVDCIDIHYLPQKVNIRPQPTTEQPCIRCGRCANVCPVGLLPQQLFWFSRSGELDKALDHRLMDCIECGACEDVCPSQIPLLSHYQFSKAEINHRTDVEIAALRSKQRFDIRNLRLQRQQLEKQNRSKEKATKATEKSQAVADALARIQAKKAAKVAAQAAQQDNNHV